MNLGEKLRQLRQQRNLTQPELAEATGIEQSYLSKLENSKYVPSSDVFGRILEVFELEVGDIVDDLDQGDRNRLRQIPVVAAHFNEQKQLIIGNRRRWLLGSAVLVAVGAALIYAGAVKVFGEEDAAAQRVECTLEHTLPGLLTGKCTGMTAESSIALQPVPDSGGDWTGAITLGNNPGLIDIVATDDGARSHYVFRSTIDWFDVSVFDSSGTPGRLVFDRSDIAAPTDADVEIIRVARDLLEAAATWDRSDDRNCDNDGPGVLGLYCALIEATSATMGKYYHRQPALQRVRRAIDEQWRNRVVSHRLMDFNNDPDTTFTDILAVLDRAEALIEQDQVRR